LTTAEDLLFCFSFPDVYTQFRTTIEKQGVRVRGLINIPNTFKPLPDGSVIKPIPTLTDFGYSSIKFSVSFTDCIVFLLVDVIVDSNSVFPFNGGESSGLSHLNNYIWDKQLVKSYKQTRNSLTGSENSTKFSAWFANISFKLTLYIFILS
jgi:deoxyribodipyrimidine photo-lyase